MFMYLSVLFHLCAFHVSLHFKYFYSRWLELIQQVSFVPNWNYLEPAQGDTFSLHMLPQEMNSVSLFCIRFIELDELAEFN